MATTSKVLFRGAASTSSTTLYTTPSATTTVVTDIVIANTATASATYELLLNDVVLAKTVTAEAKPVIVLGVAFAGITCLRSMLNVSLAATAMSLAI